MDFVTSEGSAGETVSFRASRAPFLVFLCIWRWSQHSFYLPFHVMDRHAQENVCLHPLRYPMVDGPDLEIHALETPKGPLDVRKPVVGFSGLLRRKGFLGSGGTDHQSHDLRSWKIQSRILYRVETHDG